jgi:ABC-2 type transport system ATP-binding protein
MIDVGKSYSAFSNLRVGRGSTVNFVNFFRKMTGVGGRRVTALDDVTFEVKHGEVLGLLGPNGAGKTTIIKILSTLVLPDSGKALVDGIDVTRRPRATVRHLQTVLSGNVGFDRRLTGRSSLQFFADLYGIPKKESRKRIDDLLAFTGLTEWADVMFQRYSTGMMRKVLVCRALLSNASVLLFDEPTAALDPISSADFRKLIRHDLADEGGKTILLATHNLWEAEQICDRIALLNKGRIIAIGTPAEIKAKVSDKVSLSVFVSNFLPSSEEAVTETLMEARGVRGVEIQENADDNGYTRLNIEADKTLNYNELFEKLTSVKLEIKSLESSQPSLEDAFLKLNVEAAS